MGIIMITAKEYGMKNLAIIRKTISIGLVLELCFGIWNYFGLNFKYRCCYSKVIKREEMPYTRYQVYAEYARAHCLTCIKSFIKFVETLLEMSL